MDTYLRKEMQEFSEIKIENLEVYAYHGVYPEENERGQNFYINAVLYADAREAGKRDDLELSTNYGDVCYFITDWMKQHTCRLIEAVAEQLAEAVLLKYSLVQALELEIRKPQAPIGLPFGSVSVHIRRGWHKVYLSIGSNMGDRENYIKEAVKSLGQYPHTQVVKVSELIVTKPYGGVEQEDFLNGAIEIRTLLPPRELLNRLHEIEAAADRKRLVHWGPRTLDLDILYYDKLVYEDEELMIPHVDLQNRSFVLKPLNEIAPNYRHPLLGKTTGELLAALDTSE